MAKNILVVDDDKDILTSVKMFLQMENYAVDVAENGKKALELLEKKQYDLVVLDMLMPEMSGTDVAQKIRANPKTKNQKIVFMTVITYSKQLKHAVEALKPSAYIQIPIDIDNFKEIIKTLIGKS